MRFHVRIVVAAVAAVVVLIAIAGCVTPKVQLTIPPISLSVEKAEVPPIE